MARKKASSSPLRDEDASLRNWRCVIYPDSCGGGWVETGEFDETGYPTDDLTELYIRLEDALGTPALVSPIHYGDFLESGEPEKKHIHVLMAFAGPKPYAEVLAIVSQFGCLYLKKSQNIQRDERYLAHQDTINLRKMKYPVEKVVALNGYVAKYIAEARDKSDFSALINYIEDEGIVHFCDFGFSVATKRPELVDCMRKYQAFFNSYCSSRERLCNRVMRQNALKSEKKITPLMSTYESYRCVFGGRQKG